MPTRTLREATLKLQGIDLYGYPIGLNYKGSGSFSTILGSLCSILTIVLIAINTVSIGTKFMDHSDQTEFY